MGKLLNFDTLLLLIKSEDLDVISEDHVLQAFINWYEYQSKDPNVHDVMLNDQIRKF